MFKQYDHKNQSQNTEKEIINRIKAKVKNIQYES